MTTPQTKAVQRPLWIKLALLTSAFAILPGSIVGWVLMDKNVELLLTARQQEQQTAVQSVQQTLELSLGQAYKDLFSVSHTLIKKDLNIDQKIQLSLILTSSSDILSHADIYDAEGNFSDRIAEKGTTLPEPTPTLSRDLRDLALSKEVAFGPISGPPNARTIQLIVPIRYRADTVDYLASNISLQPIQQRLSEIATDLPQFTGLRDPLFVIDQSSTIIAHPDPKRLSEDTKLESFGINTAFLKPSAFKTRASMTEVYTSQQGQEILGTFQPMSHLPLAVIAQAPTEKALAEISEMRMVFLIAGLIALVLSLLSAFLLAKRLTNPIRDLVAMARALAERNFAHKSSVQTRDELEVLAHAMNQASEDLKSSEDQIKHEVAIRKDLGRYLPEQLVDRVVQREQDMKLGGQRRTITVLFADVVRFTPMTESLKPEDTVAILNQLFTIMTEIVFRHRGTVDKFMGDCVMAFWNAPQDQEDHAELAVQTAEDMIHWLEIGNSAWNEQYGVTIQLAIGIHTGEVVVGNIGSEQRMEYTAIGDTVNVAARLEAMARPQQILITETTRQYVEGLFDLTTLGTHDLSGRSRPIQLYEVLT